MWSTGSLGRGHSSSTRSRWAIASGTGVEALLFGSIEREELVEADSFLELHRLRAMEFSLSISELHGDILY